MRVQLGCQGMKRKRACPPKVPDELKGLLRSVKKLAGINTRSMTCLFTKDKGKTEGP